MRCDSGSSSVIILFGVYGYRPIAFIEVVSDMADLIKVRYSVLLYAVRLLHRNRTATPTSYNVARSHPSASNLDFNPALWISVYAVFLHRSTTCQLKPHIHFPSLPDTYKPSNIPYRSRLQIFSLLPRQHRIYGDPYGKITVRCCQARL